MKPLIYSRLQAQNEGIGWRRGGEDITYYQTPVPTMAKKSTQNVLPTQAPIMYDLYTLSFKISFKHDNDSVYFAYCFPYTYSDCQNYLNKISCTANKDWLRRSPLCKTIAGNECDILIITNFLSIPDVIATRPAIILTARVHPGETNASFIMEGVIDYLLSSDEGAKILRNRFVFKIVPMLNPDGVVVGNYRCSLSGFDLNR